MLTELLKNENPSIRVQALQLLNTRLWICRRSYGTRSGSILDLVDELVWLFQSNFDVGSIRQPPVSQLYCYSVRGNHPDKFFHAEATHKHAEPPSEGGLKTDANDALRSTVFCALATLVLLGPRVLPAVLFWSLHSSKICSDLETMNLRIRR